MFSRFFSILFLLSCVSCTAKYVVPQSGPTAVVQYVTGIGIPSVSVYSYDNENCENPKKIADVGHAKNDGVLSFSGSDEPRTPDKTVVIPATGTFVNRFVFAAPRGYRLIEGCQMTVAFQPQPGKTYHVYFGIAEPKCVVVVYDVDPVSGALVREPTARSAVNLCKSWQ